MGRQSKKDDEALGCLAVIGGLLGISVIGSGLDFLANNAWLIVVFAIMIAGIGVWLAHISKKVKRHDPAIAVLKILSYPDSQIRGTARTVIENYIHTIDHYSPRLKSPTNVIKDVNASPSSLSEYLGAIQHTFDKAEIDIFLDHARRVRESDHTRNDLADKWHVEVKRALTAPQAQPARRATQIEDESELSGFRRAISDIRRSDLPDEQKALAGRLSRKVETIVKLDFHPDIEMKLEDLICNDIPKLVSDWKGIAELSSGKAKEEADSAFTLGLRRLCMSFEALLEKQASLASGSVSATSIYLQSKHVLDEDDPFHADAGRTTNDILPTRE